MLDPKSKNRLDGRKYLVVPGMVESENDGTHHWVSCGELVRLYGVDPARCLFDDAVGRMARHREGGYAFDLTGLTVLRPDPTGRYRLEEDDGVDV